MSNAFNSNAGTPWDGRFTARIDGKPYRTATPAEIGQSGPALRMWVEQRVSDQNAKAEPFAIELKDLSQGAGFSYYAESLPNTYAWSAGFDAWAPGIISTRAHLTTGDSFVSTDVRGWQFDLGGYLYVCRGRFISKYKITQGSTPWALVEKHDVDGTSPTGKVVTGRPAVFKGKAYVPIRTGATGSLTLFQELTTVATTVVESQTIAISGTPTSGTYTITFDGKTTANIAYNADAATVQAALRLIPGLEAVTVTSSGTIPNFTHTVVMTGVGGALGAASAPQMTSTDSMSGGAHAIAHATTVAGTTDTWTTAAAKCVSAGFRVYGNKLAKAQGNTASTDASRVYFCESDPMVFANWAPAESVGYEFGDYGHAITDLAQYTPYLVVGKTNGIFTLDESYQSHNAIEDFAQYSDPANGVGMEVVQGEVVMPNKAGLIVWDGSSYDVIGVGQEGFFNPTADRGDGRFYSIAPAGELAYYVANDAYNGYAVLGSFRNPEARRFSYGSPSRAKVWQTYEIEADARYESVVVLSASGEPSSPKTPGTITDDNAVGTLTWSNPSNAGAEDSSYATTSGTGTTHYLKALSPQPNVPTEATIVGIAANVVRSGYATLAATTAQAGTAYNTSLATYALNRETTPSNSGGSGGSFFVGQGYDGTPGGKGYQVAQGFLDFDTSSIPDSATILSAALSMTVDSAGDIETWTMQARLHDFGASITTADFIAGSSLSSKTLLATKDMTAVGLGSITMTEVGSALRDNISKTGNTRMVLCSDLQVAGTAPTTGQYGIYDVLSGATLTVTYKDVTDSVVKLVIGGAVSGSNLADTVTQWTNTDTQVTYGSGNNLWGLTPTAAQVNAADFGIVISAVSTTAATFKIDHVDLIIYYTVPGQGDSATLISVLVVDETRTIAYPRIYQLPRNGARASYDPQLARARDNAIFQTSRYDGPGRNVAKVYDRVEFYAEMSASDGAGPAFNVKYSLNDTDWDYLLDGDGAVLEVGAALGASGKGKVSAYFPRTSANWGANLNLGTVALQFVLAEKTGVQVDTSVVIRDVVILGFYKPTRAGEFSLTFTLGELEIANGFLLRSVQEQAANLRAAVAPGNYPLPYQSPDGRSGYAVFADMELHEGTFYDQQRKLTWPMLIASVTGRWVE